MCEIREWSLELDAPAVDTTGGGEKFGESVKSLVTGGGSADFFIDRKCMDDGKDNGLYMMQLLLMTQMDGCKAKAKFFMMEPCLRPRGTATELHRRFAGQLLVRDRDLGNPKCCELATYSVGCRNCAVRYGRGD